MKIETIVGKLQGELKNAYKLQMMNHVATLEDACYTNLIDSGKMTQREYDEKFSGAVSELYDFINNRL